MGKFDHLLDKPAGDIKAPELPPEGTYYGRTAKDHPKLDSVNTRDDRGEVPVLEVTCVLERADDDVDLDGFEGRIEGRKARYTFWLDDESQYRFVNFMRSCGVTVEGRTLRELISMVPDQEIVVACSHKQSKKQDGGTFLNIDRLSGTANLEA